MLNIPLEEQDFEKPEENDACEWANYSEENVDDTEVKVQESFFNQVSSMIQRIETP